MHKRRQTRGVVGRRKKRGGSVRTRDALQRERFLLRVIWARRRVNEQDHRWASRDSQCTLYFGGGGGGKLFGALLLNGVYTPACGVRRSRAFVCTCPRVRAGAMIYCSSERRQRCEVQRD